LIYNQFRDTYGADSINWCGFYLVKTVTYLNEPISDEHREDKEELLVLGPFQGLPAVTIIHPGHGVCGTAMIQRQAQVVADVHIILIISPVIVGLRVRLLYLSLMVIS